MNARKSYPSDVSDEVWEFVVPYLSLLPLDAGQRDHDLREVFNGLRWLVWPFFTVRAERGLLPVQGRVPPSHCMEQCWNAKNYSPQKQASPHGNVNDGLQLWLPFGMKTPPQAS